MNETNGFGLESVELPLICFKNREKKSEP